MVRPCNCLQQSLIKKDINLLVALPDVRSSSIIESLVDSVSLCLGNSNDFSTTLPRTQCVTLFPYLAPSSDRTHCLVERPLAQPRPLGNMSTRSSQADLHRILSREQEAYIRHSHATKPPEVGPDPAYLDHLGAHFSASSRKGVFPVYPEGVEVSEDESTTAQLDSATSRILSSCKVQGIHGSSARHYPLTMPTLSLSHDHSSVSPDDFLEFQRQRAHRHRCYRGSGK